MRPNVQCQVSLNGQQGEMLQPMDLSYLDRPEVLEVLFPLAYSPLFLPAPSPPVNAPTYPIETEEGIIINCNFWIAGKENPTILYFHGNGETVADHEWIAPYYNRRGINLFVADYRGYGSSDGKPTISNMLRDAQAVFQGFREIIKGEGFKESLFVMGRSLGSLPAVELAYNQQDGIKGLIVESGTANNFRRLWSSVGISEDVPVLNEDSLFLNKVKIRYVKKPVLIIHGETDELIPVGNGEELYQNAGTKEKRILIITGAGHNDVMMVDPELYFGSIEEFVTACG